MNKSFCVLPWINISVDPDGRIRPCSISADEIKKPDGTHYNLGHDKLTDIINSPDYQKLRRKMKAGELVEGCSQCYNAEKYANSSNRSFHNLNWYAIEEIKDKIDNHTEIIPETVEFFDLRFGNLCNLKCRSCGPICSSQLNKEIKEIVKTNSKFNTYMSPENLDDINDWYQTKTFSDNLQSQTNNIRRIHFTGGEPTLIDNNYEMMRYFIDNGKSKNITLKFNTNLTNVNTEFVELIQQFKHVTILASIDGYGDVQEYLRFPSNWNQIDKNLNKLVDLTEHNVEIICSPVIQKTNLGNIVDLFDYINNINIRKNRLAVSLLGTVLNNPARLDLSYLPIEYKQRSWDKISNWLENTYQYKSNDFLKIMEQLKNRCSTDVDYKSNMVAFKEFTDIMDIHRNHFLKDINLELYEIMNK